MGGDSLIDSFEYSVRRRYLDRDLEAASGVLAGQVLEIGNGRIGRRGRFQPPQTGIARWTYLDRDAARRPHIRADATGLPFQSSLFDAVVCLEVLEYVWQPQAALIEISRVLKPGGVLLLSTPFLHRVDAANDYWRFTEPGLRVLLQKAGFEVVQWHAQGNALAASVNVLRYVVSVQRSWVRRVVSIILRPIFEMMLSVDSAITARRPNLASFATGYMVVARRTRHTSA